MKYYPFLLLLICFCSCSYDYDVGDSRIQEKDYLIVNSLLNPNRPISIYFYRTQQTDTGYICLEVENLSVSLKEDNKVIFEGLTPSPVLTLDHYPKTGSTYSISVNDTDGTEVYATTRIPEAISCVADMSFGDSKYAWPYYLAYLNEFPDTFDERVTLWVTAYKVFESAEFIQYNELYANNLLVDNVNRNEGMEVLNPTVGSLYYDGFLRVKNRNLTELNELIFTPAYAHYGEYRPDSEQQGIRIKLTTASPEYDQYCTSLFKQKAMIIYEDDISAIVYQPTQVYSNVHNGLGIFAGVNEIDYYFSLPE